VIDTIDKAVVLLREDKIVVAPTETVYGLFGDATSDMAIQKIYEIKDRPLCNPLILHVASIDMACDYAEISSENERVINSFWKNRGDAITFVVPLKRNSGISNLVTAGLDTIAIRMPNHPIALEIIRKFGKPLAAPSANTSNNLSPTLADMVKKDIGDKVSFVIDAGESKIGVESTILDITKSPYVVLRHGGISIEYIKNVIEKEVIESDNEIFIKAPGMMQKHYALSIKLRMNAEFPENGEAFIAFGKTLKRYEANLSESGNLNEAAHNLFSAIKSCDDKDRFIGIAVMPIPDVEIGRAINDRLKRASLS
jgi:L-threonylcarbamoyladenylate synthase